MIDAISLVLALAALLGILATSALFIQACACLVGTGRAAIPATAHRPSAAVLIPAHNEEAGVDEFLAEILGQLGPHDRLVVVADNCSDATAARAARAGAEVIVREDPRRRGKGFALAAGLRHLAAAPPEVVVFIDADCRFSAGGVETLSRACAALGAPVQCRNLMVAGPSASASLRLAEFAWRIKNEFRPRGYALLGLPCHLLGTGMALPWSLIDPAVFATGHVAEDLRIGVDCAAKGYPPRFLPEVNVISEFAQSRSGRQSQRKRWIHGHLSLIASHAPRLVWVALRRLDVGLLALAADLVAPPLGLLATFNALVLALAGAGAAFLGAGLPLLLSLCANGLLAFSLIAAWRLCGRDLIGVNELAAAPRHLLGVLQIGASFVKGDRSAWVRAERHKSP